MNLGSSAGLLRCRAGASCLASRLFGHFSGRTSLSPCGLTHGENRDFPTCAAGILSPGAAGAERWCQLAGVTCHWGPRPLGRRRRWGPGNRAEGQQEAPGPCPRAPGGSEQTSKGANTSPPPGVARPTPGHGLRKQIHPLSSGCSLRAPLPRAARARG